MFQHFNAQTTIICLRISVIRWTQVARPPSWASSFLGASSYHMSSSDEYSVAPSKASGGRYQSVTTSEEYVWLGMDLARARPVQREWRWHPLSWVFLGAMVAQCARECVNRRVNKMKGNMPMVGTLARSTQLAWGLCILQRDFLALAAL